MGPFAGDTTPDGLPLRADARRNRAKVLAAAHEAFASEGLAVPLDEIARRAGVGAGTVYRHFPTKESLFEAVVLGRVRELVDRLHELASSTDPGSALFGSLHELSDTSVMKNDLVDALAGAGVDITDALARSQRELKTVLGELLARAQQAGAVRTDIGLTDLLLLLRSILLAGQQHPVDLDAQRRAITVIADGLRVGP